MIKKLCIVLYVAVCWIISAFPASANSCKEITLGGHPDFPPLVWSDGQRMRGAGPHIAKQIFEEMGVQVRYWEKQPYARIQRHLEMGQIDLLAGMARNSEREKYSIFIEPAMATIQPYVFTDIDHVFNFFSWDQLRGKRGAIVRGMIFGNQFDTFAKDKLDIVQVDSTETALKLIARGRVDYMVQNFRRAQIEIDRLNYEGQIVALNAPLGVGEQKIYFAFSSLSPCRHLANEFTRKFQKYVASGAVERLLYTYLWKFGVF